MIIDCHGHYTTAPKSLEGWRARGTDLTLFSPRAMVMSHHIGDAATSEGQDMNLPPLAEHLVGNEFFDTRVHQPGIDLLLKATPVDNIPFASEMVGAVRGIDPETGSIWTTSGATPMPWRTWAPMRAASIPAFASPRESTRNT